MTQSLRNIASAQNENRKAKEKVKLLEGEAQKEDHENESLKRELEENVQAKRDLTETPNDLKSKHEQIPVKLNSNRRLLGTTDESNKELQSQKNQLEIELRQVKQRKEDANKRLEDSENQYKERERNLRSQLAEALSMGQESPVNELIVQELKFALAEEKAEVLRKEKYIKQKQKEIHSLDERVSELVQENFDFKRGVTAEKREAEDLVKRFQGEVDELSKDVSELEAENKSVREQLDKSRIICK